jgi:hypothetical protein
MRFVHDVGAVKCRARVVPVWFPDRWALRRRELTWLCRHLGRSSTAVTDVYSHWEAKARKAEVEKMEGVFGA